MLSMFWKSPLESLNVLFKKLYWDCFCIIHGGKGISILLRYIHILYIILFYIFNCQFIFYQLYFEKNACFYDKTLESLNILFRELHWSCFCMIHSSNGISTLNSIFFFCCWINKYHSIECEYNVWKRPKYLYWKRWKWFMDYLCNLLL